MGFVNTKTCCNYKFLWMVASVGQHMGIVVAIQSWKLPDLILSVTPAGRKPQ
jgi:hypothetical protein